MNQSNPAKVGLASFTRTNFATVVSELLPSQAPPTRSSQVRTSFPNVSFFSCDAFLFNNLPHPLPRTSYSFGCKATVLRLHPRIYATGPEYNPKFRTQGFDMSITPLLLVSASWDLQVFDEAIKYPLDSLESSTLSARKLCIEVRPYIFPLFCKIDSMIPDEEHLFFSILWPRRSSTLAYVDGASGRTT